LIKIIHVTHLSTRGGANNALSNFIAQIHNSNIENVLICPSNGYITEIVQKYNLTKIYYLNNYGVFAHTTALYYQWYRTPQLIRDIFKLVLSIKPFVEIYRREKPDYIHLNSSIMLGPAIAAKICKVKVLWHVREHIKYGIKGIIHILFLKSLSWEIIAINNATAQKIKSKNTIVKYDYIEKIKKYDISRTDRNMFIISFLGGIHEMKGTLDVLKAVDNILSHSQYKKIKLLIAGDVHHYPQRNKILSIINISYISFKRYYKRVVNIINKWPDNITFLKVVDSVDTLLANSDVLVIAHKKPHSALPIFEAASMQKSVVSYRYKETEEFIINAKTGILLNKNNCFELANELKYLIENRTKCHEYGLNAFSYIHRLVKNNSKVNIIE